MQLIHYLNHGVMPKLCEKIEAYMVKLTTMKGKPAYSALKSEKGKFVR